MAHEVISQWATERVPPSVGDISGTTRNGHRLSLAAVASLFSGRYQKYFKAHIARQGSPVMRVPLLQLSVTIAPALATLTHSRYLQRPYRRFDLRSYPSVTLTSIASAVKLVHPALQVRNQTCDNTSTAARGVRTQ